MLNWEYLFSLSTFSEDVTLKFINTFIRTNALLFNGHPQNYKIDSHNKKGKKSSLIEVSEVYLFAYYEKIPREIDRSQNVVHRTWLKDFIILIVKKLKNLAFVCLKII